MATEDSREQFDNPRWGYTAADVASGFVAEPPGQKKDDGWEPAVDPATGEWWNWLHQQASYFLGYLEATWLRRWTVPHMFRSEKGTTAGDVSAGVGLSVDVVAAQVWMEGGQYTVPAATNLALAAADPTDDRFDLVVARIVALAPVYFVITGTPDPAPQEPTPLADDVPIARVRVNATATVPGSIANRREYGVLELDRLVVEEIIDDAGGDVIDFKTNGGVSPILTLFDNNTGLALLNIQDKLIWAVETGPFSLAGLVGDLQLPGPQVEMSTALVRKYDMSAWDFMLSQLAVRGLGQSAADLAHGASTDAIISTGSSGTAKTTVRIPDGATITGYTVYGNKPGSPDVSATLAYRVLTSGTETNINTSDTSALGTGNFAFGPGGLTEVVNQNRVYYMSLTFDAQPDSCSVWGVSVHYTIDRPWFTL